MRADRVKAFFFLVSDMLVGLLNPSPPSFEKRQSCKIISHRGEHDNQQYMENTLAAFDRILAAGIWGIEFDIRWTRDSYPVVFHDRDLERLFSIKTPLQHLALSELKTKFPMIPGLYDVVSRYGHRLHLIVEIKGESFPESADQVLRLKDIFSNLTPCLDYHFISFHPETFEKIDFVPPKTFLPIAGVSPHRLSRLSLEKKYGGITGHYLFLSRALIRRHQRQNQIVGTGFVNSRNSLFRELNRGVEWIFTNQALRIQEMVGGNS
jgi:glycerophosphoryl diester phosphodiesterase